jgi:competence protein ComEC
VAVLLCLLTVAIYTLLVGAAPSVVRAAIMGGLAVIASELGRRSASLNALALTAALMCLFSPGLLQDVSFQLSTAATLGLVLFSAPLQAAFSRQVTARLPAGAAKHATRLVSDYLLTTLAAQITTLPVIAFHFQRFSLSALLANPLILPPQPLVMMVGGLSVLAGSLLPPLGQALAWLAQPFAAYTIHMVELLAQIPGGEIYLNPASPLWLAAYYGIILLIAFQHKLAGKVGGWVRQLITPSLMVIAAVGLTATAWQAVLKQPDGRLHLTVLNVPDGPALLLQTPGGRALLINSGSSARILLDQLGRRLPTPGPGLDWIWGTDRRAAALAAFEGVLPRYPARQAALNLLPASTRTRERLVETLQKRGTALHTLEAKMRLDLGDGANLEVVTASKQGAALLVEYGSFRALIPGGMAPPGLADLPPPARQDLSLLVLGSADSEFLSDPIWANLAPQLVVVCSPMPAFPFDLPNVSLFSGGWLHLRSDGTTMELEEK